LVAVLLLDEVSLLLAAGLSVLVDLLSEVPLSEDAPEDSELEEPWEDEPELSSFFVEE
jgi:hypothetical protein